MPINAPLTASVAQAGLVSAVVFILAVPALARRRFGLVLLAVPVAFIAKIADDLLCYRAPKPKPDDVICSERATQFGDH